MSVDHGPLVTRSKSWRYEHTPPVPEGDPDAERLSDPWIDVKAARLLADLRVSDVPMTDNGFGYKPLRLTCDRCGVLTECYQGPYLGRVETEYGSFDRYDWICKACIGWVGAMAEGLREG